MSPPLFGYVVRAGAACLSAVAIIAGFGAATLSVKAGPGSDASPTAAPPSLRLDAGIAGYASPSPNGSPPDVVTASQTGGPPFVSPGPLVGAAGAPAAPARVVVKLREPVADNLAKALPPGKGPVNLTAAAAIAPRLAALLAKHSVRKASPVFDATVRARRQTGRSEQQQVNAMRQRFFQRTARAPRGARPPDLASTYVFELGDGAAATLAERIRALRNDPDVLYAEEDRMIRVDYVPNDPSYSSTGSWGQSYADLYGLKKIGTTQAWDVTQGQGVVVAVVDTGVDYHHPDISANIWSNPGEIPGNGIDDDQNGFVDDVRGWDFVGHDVGIPTEDNDPNDGYFHGTHVAGTIAATGDNGIGVVGVAWKAKIMPVKGLDDNGSGYDSDLARAIIYAVDNGADVINASWGGAGSSQVVADAVNYAHAQGVVFVAAAGNAGREVSGFSPANVPAAITVSSVSPSDYQSVFTNTGSKLDVAAPGEDILSLQSGTTDYVRANGTSMAAPHVSGTAALILEQHPTFTNEQVRQALRVSTTKINSVVKDFAYGYGRLNAAQAVAVDHVLAARIFSPNDHTNIAGPYPLIGTATGPGFHYYTVEYGTGEHPNDWILVHTSMTSVTEGDIGTFDPSHLSDGTYTIRLSVFDTDGNVYSDQILVHVRYLAITAPVPPPVASLSSPVKPGTVLAIAGSAQGPTFQSYKLEWALGYDEAASAWSTAGLALPGGGLSPVTEGVLGTWTIPSDLKGYYMIRLTVTNADFSSTTTTAIYAEPDLLSSNWPRLSGSPYYLKNAQPLRQPDGTTRLLLRDAYTPYKLRSFGVDGSEQTAQLAGNILSAPLVGNLDGLPGDEIVLGDANWLKIFSSDLTLRREIFLTTETAIGYDELSLADLDNDGVPEILVPIRYHRAPDYSGEAGGLYVFRTDGTLYSDHYPVPFETKHIFGDDGIKVLGADLDGDGTKEVVLAYSDKDGTSYQVTAVRADGTPLPGWSTPTIADTYLDSMVASDLDHNGSSELILSGNNQPLDRPQIRVIDSTGSTRPGWPATLPTRGMTNLAIADLDNDHMEEILLVTSSQLTVWRPDGTPWIQPVQITNASPWSSNRGLLVADTDNDGVSEILVSSSDLSFHQGRNYWNTSIGRYRSDGTLLESWPIFGRDGQQPFTAMPVIGDFNHDGQTDIVVQVGMIAGGDISGFLSYTSMTYLTIGSSAAVVDRAWPSVLHDPQQSRTSTAAPQITGQPQNQTVGSGQSATLSAAASGSPFPSFQWRKNGVDIAGATLGNLVLPPVHLADSGNNYSVVVSNLAGSVASNTATLTVTQGSQTITFSGPSDQTYGVAPISLSATATSGLPVQFSVVSGPASVSGSTLTIAGAGDVTIRAKQPGNTEYLAAPDVDRTFHVNKATATVTLGNLSQVYNGSPRSATATTTPSGLAVAFTYNGSTTAPTNAGSYTVVATIGDQNYDGQATNTLTIAKATPTITWPTPAPITYGTPLGAAQLNATANVPGAFSYSPNAGTLFAAGSQTLLVNFTPTDTVNYTNANAQRPLVVNKAPVTITLSGLTAVYDGTPRVAIATTNPVGAGVSVTYNGFPTAPTDVGSYAVVASVSSQNYTGPDATGTLTIAKATPTVTWPSFAAIAYGTALDSVQLNATATVPGTFSYNPAAGSRPGVGTHQIAATFAPSDTSNYEVVNLSRSLTVYQAAATVTLGNLNAIWDGTPKSAVATTEPIGVSVTITYDGSNSAPSNPGSYAVVATINDPNYTGNASGTLTISDPGPVIIGQSATRIVIEPGQSQALAVNAFGTNPLTYQWTHNGQAIPGATGSSWTMSNPAINDSGYYLVTVSNAAGSVRSAPFFVQVAPVTTEVVAWGFASFGETTIPADLQDAIAISATNSHVLALRSNGTVVAWGNNSHGQTTVPPGLSDVVKISAGGAHSLALKSDGTVIAWGDNSCGQSTVPAGLSGVVAISAGGTHSMALKSDGSLVAWGNDINHQVSAIPNLTDAVAIAAGIDFSLVLRRDGQIMEVGYDHNGIPLGANVPYGTSHVAIAAGGGTGLALKGDGTVVAWNGVDLQPTGMTAPAGLSGVTAIAMGGEFALALNSNGTAVAWTSPAYGNLPALIPPSNVNHVVAIAAGWACAVALRDATNDPAPVITTQPVSQITTAGRSVTFTAAARGIPTPTYQWKKNGVAIAGATSPTLTIVNLQAGDAGSYAVTVTNSGGTATSIAATLTVVASATGSDLNGDAKADLIWQNRITGERSFWLMNGTAFGSGFAFWTVDPSWQIVGTGDFDSDGRNDLVWTNTSTGERSIWLMDGTAFKSGISLGTLPLDWQIAAIGDFSSDGNADLVWQNARTGESSIWLMNGTSFTGVALPTPPVNRQIVASGDFNGDGKVDLVWTDTNTGERLVWLMNGTSFASEVSLGTVPKIWQIVGSADYNGDGKSDLVWTNTGTGERTIWLMSGTIHTGTVAVGTVTLDWVLGRTQAVPAPVQSDFTGDANSDLIWQNLATGERSLWIMNGPVFSSGVSLGTIPTNWRIVASGDFNADGKSDLVWANTTTGERSFWLMNGTTFNYGISLGTIPTNWQIVASGDYNGDGKSDLVWSNTITGERSIWLMNGTSYSAGVSLGTASTNWQIVASGDFNADGKSDLAWSDTLTGERSVWLMDGTSFTAGASLGVMPTNWQIVGTGDFNADGKSDLIWTDNSTGLRIIWLMDGTVHSGTVSLGTIPAQWQIRN